MNPRTISIRNEAIMISAESRTVSQTENIIDRIHADIPLNDQRMIIIRDNNSPISSSKTDFFPIISSNFYNK